MLLSLTKQKLLSDYLGNTIYENKRKQWKKLFRGLISFSVLNVPPYIKMLSLCKDDKAASSQTGHGTVWGFALSVITNPHVFT